MDVGNNTALEYLYCFDTGITSLDVGNNTALTALLCYSTGITSLDVSNNTALTALRCNDIPLAYLNIGANNNLTILAKGNLKPVNAEVTGDTFNMADKFAGIEVDKISNVSGADYENGVMRNYSIGTPITYAYACGISANGAETIAVTLNLTDIQTNSTISITEDLNKAYDGNAVTSTPTVSKTGSTGAVSYKWEQKKNNNNWEDIASAPTDAGTYRVTAILASDNDYPEATSVPVEFTISPKNVKNNKDITVSAINSNTNLDNLVIKDGDKVLVQGTDYDVAKTQDGNKVTVTIAFKGNYTGTITKTYTVAIDKPKDEPKDTGSVQTGDTSSVGLWSSLLAFSAGIAVFLKRKKQRKEIEE